MAVKKLLIWLIVVVMVGAPTTASVGGQGQRPSFIRDAEIEATIRSYATPLFEAAGLEAEAVHVYLLQDENLNAFIAGGMNLFINTGTLIRTKTPNQMIGIIAHETGHMAGGHLARMQEELRKATIQSIIAMVVGMGAAAAAGNSGAGGAVIGAGNSLVQRNLLAYSRTQESSADQAGMSFLDRTGQSARGMLQVFQMLMGEELRLSGNLDPYLQTHPLTQDRIAAVQDHVEHAKYSDAPDPPELVIAHNRMRAKLIGFLQPLARVLRQYPETDASLEARYARSIAYYRRPDLKKALPLIDGLIAERPDDPYFQELKGQMLFENGRGGEALKLYESALRLAPHEPLLRYELAQVQIELGDPKLNKLALGNLEEVVRNEPKSSEAWRLLSIAYGRDDQLPMTALALAEAAAARGNGKEARLQADRAMQQMKEGSPGWLRAQDIMNEAVRDEDQ